MSVDEAGRGKGLLDQDGERRTIVVKNGDTIRPLFGRSQAHKDLNNEVRELFKETVLKVCDAQTLDDLPKAVQDVMKKGDYDNGGHPLSLRRIRAVTSAILAEAQKESEAGGAQGRIPAAGVGAAPAKGFDAKSLDKRLENFRRKAAVVFADNLLNPNDSDLKVAIKQNLLMNLALARAASPKDSLADAIEEHYDTLAGRYGKRDFLAEIAPGLGTK
ncbi:MAG: hypothetical protein IJL06_08805 [Kiritimatiellae bacterium]|nr:hypothetical protein [Kiritimatiellia bacterium]